MVASGINETKVKLQMAEDKLAQINYGLSNTQGAIKNWTSIMTSFKVGQMYLMKLIWLNVK